MNTPTPGLPLSAREKRLFELAFDLGDAASRDAFLRRECGQDATLLQRLRALLAAHAATAAFLPGEPGAPAEAPPAERPGDLIGRYKLLEQVGEGGCGVVYVAEQTEPVRRRVALKVIKLGMDTKSVVARFEAERQALALMDHPNIAKVLDAGATGRGRPYFVMELVRGIPITAYCDQNNLSTQARLGLFIQVCHAIQHAHQKGIIHRDIKPSNILVTVNDGVAVPKVIDFGIAKATEGRLTDATVYTQLHQFIGTPAYMSPEQAEMTSLDIDTRSDIYSLGVLLYELLAGRTPFEAKELMAAGLDAMRRIVREQEPARPSTRLATLQGEELSTTAKRRATEAPKLLRQLQGDLDWIVMKCLEKDRTRRYETANGLAADLRRHLDNEPVTARPPSAAYRLQKAWRRHRPAFAVAGLIALVLVGATVFSAWQARLARAAAAAAQAARLETAAPAEAEREARQEAAARAEAERAAREEATARAEAERAARGEAESLSAFLTTLFRSPDPRQDGRTVTVAETLERAARKLNEELAAEPARQAALQTALANTHLGLGLFAEAAALLERARDNELRAPETDADRRLGTLALLAAAYQGAGRTDEATRLREEVLARRRESLGPDHADTVAALLALSESYRSDCARADEATQLVREVVAIRERTLGADDLQTREAAVLLGLLDDLNGLGGREDLIQAAREVLEHTRAEAGPEHPRTIGALARLARHLPARLKAEKTRLLHEALALSRKVNGPEHRVTLDLLAEVALFESRAGDPQEAVRLYQEQLLPLALRTAGPEAPETFHFQMQQAEGLARAGRVEDALALAEATMPRVRARLDALTSFNPINSLAFIYSAVPDGRRRDEAIELRQESLRIVRQYRPECPTTVHAMMDLARELTTAGRHAEALRWYAELAPLSRRVFGPESPENVVILAYAAVGCLGAERPDTAIPWLEEALPVARQRFGVGADWTHWVQSLLSRAHLEAGGWGGAAPPLLDHHHPPGVGPPDSLAAIELAVVQLWFGETEGYDIPRQRLLEQHGGTQDPVTAERVAKSASLRPAADPEAAGRTLALARRAVERGADHAYLVWFRLALGMAEHRAGHHEAAESALLAAEYAAENYAPANRPRIQGPARFYRAMALFRLGRIEEARRLHADTAAAMSPLPTDERRPLRNAG
ncbi:MAG TPA: serine/threonine-protein kinase, partial [Verrucomicrobiota bacterium]|nr:serine/threonine-protein kinase [Verrucomicrobiota bacterium]